MANRVKYSLLAVSYVTCTALVMHIPTGKIGTVDAQDRFSYVPSQMDRCLIPLLPEEIASRFADLNYNRHRPQQTEFRSMAALMQHINGTRGDVAEQDLPLSDMAGNRLMSTEMITRLGIKTRVFA